MTRAPLRALTVVAVFLALSGAPLPVLAEEGAPETGWWSRTRIGAPSPVEAPHPFVPEGGTYVSGGVGGAVAVSALRLELPDDDQATELSLAVAEARGTPEVTVCPSIARWPAVQGGHFDEAPEADCTVSATGRLVEDRLVVPLDGLPPGTLDVVLEPAEGATFSLSMQPADARSVTVVPGSADDAPPPDGGTTAPPDQPADGGSALLPPFADAPLPPVDLRPGEAPPLLAGELPGLASPTQPEVAGLLTAGPRSRISTRPSAAAPLDDRAQALPAALLLLGLAALAAKLNGTPVRAPVPLGGAARLRRTHPAAQPAAAEGIPVALATVPAAATVPRVRGVGRFRTERRGRPTPL